MSDSERGFWVNALLGAIVSVVLSWLPFAPILGGGVAGYLQRDDEWSGAKVGAVSGVIAALPLVAILFLVFGFFGLVGVASGPDPGFLGFSAVVLVIGLFVFVLSVAYSVGLGAVGGLLGVLLYEETAEESAPADGDAESGPTVAPAEQVGVVTDEPDDPTVVADETETESGGESEDEIGSEDASGPVDGTDRDADARK